MKHLFVPYLIAKALKEKGFNEPCLAYYNPVVDISMGTPLFKPVDTDFVTFREVVDPCIKAPLYQQAVDWLFKRGYNLHSAWLTEDQRWVCDVYTVDSCDLLWSGILSEVEPFEFRYVTYYEAVTKAIEEALKLMK